MEWEAICAWFDRHQLFNLCLVAASSTRQGGTTKAKGVQVDKRGHGRGLPGPEPMRTLLTERACKGLLVMH